MIRLASLRSIALGVAMAGSVIDAGHAADTTLRPDFTSDTFLVGNWSCETARGDKPAGHEDAHYAFGLDGRWLKLDYTLHPPGRTAIHTEAYETFDQTEHQWTYVSMRSDGTWGVSYSTGWKNGSKVYTPASDTPQTFEELIATKVTADEFTEDQRRPASDGSWTTIWFNRCKRSAPAR